MIDPSQLSPPPPNASGLGPDLSALDSVNFTPEQLEATKKDLDKSERAEDDLTRKEVDSTNERFTAPPPQQGNPLTGLAPLLLFSAFGGPKMKGNASAMLGATTGVVKGYLSGSAEAYQTAVDQYKQKFEEFKAHQEQQQRIYKEMREAYKGRIDADLKALQFARQVTGDAAKIDQHALDAQERMDQAFDKLQAQVDHWTSQDQVASTKLSLQERALALKKAKAEESAATDPDQIKLQAQLFMKDPTNTRFTAAERQQIMKYLAKQGVSADDIVNGRAQTKVAYAEARSLGNQKAQLERVENALTQPGGVADQAQQAAAALNASDLKGINSIKQLFASQSSNKALAAYKIKMLALRDEYATVINKGAAPTDQSRAQATEAMDGLQVTAVPAVVKAIKEVAASNKQALQTSIEEMGRSAAPPPGNPGAATPQAQPPAAQAPGAATAQPAQQKVVPWGSLQ